MAAAEQRVTPPRPRDPKEAFRTYLRSAREALLWKLDGLSERQLRTPMTLTGTNLLGLAKHCAGVEIGYLTECFGRPSGVDLSWMSLDAGFNVDMYATQDESREQIVALVRRAAELTDASLDALELDSEGYVPWWERNPVTLHLLLIHVSTELNRHVGHADILRELLDGKAGLNAGNDNLPPADEQRWTSYREHLGDIARTFPDEA